MQRPENKHLVISPQMHKAARIFAAHQGLNLRQLTERALIEYMEAEKVREPRETEQAA